MSELSWVTQSQVPEFGLIKSASVILTDDQIKALPATPVVIVPATETSNYSGNPATIPIPIAASVLLDVSDGNYDDIDANALLEFGLGSDFSQLVGAATSVAVDNSTGALTIIPATFNNGTSFYTFTFGAWFTPNGGLKDNSVSLANFLTADELSGGGPANTLKVTVYYVLVDLS